MAFAGVDMGRVKANPAGTAMAYVTMEASMENLSERPIPTGRSMAMTAALLMPSVRTMARSENAATAAHGLETHSPSVFSASHPAAPLLSSAEPKIIAPPYMSIMPQLTYSSISFHLTSLSTKSKTTEIKAMVASPPAAPHITHANTVSPSTAPTAYSP